MHFLFAHAQYVSLQSKVTKMLLISCQLFSSELAVNKHKE